MSNTLAGTSNNYILEWESAKKVVSRSYFQLCEYGSYTWRFWFSNTVDSTFDDGSVAWADKPGGSWKILSAAVGVSDTKDGEPEKWHPLTFAGKNEKNVALRERFWSDPAELAVASGRYLVFRWTVEGNGIPVTPDSQIPSYLEQDGALHFEPYCPKPNLIACDRKVKRRIAFLGDSITQGCETVNDKYEFWCAKIGKALGKDYSIWNLGLGFGRAYDAARDGAWLYRARKMDSVVVCFGVNDILRGRSAQQLCGDLETIVSLLQQSGCRVVLFTTPPFDLFTPEQQKVWREVNQFVRAADFPDAVFDIASVLGHPAPDDAMPKYGGHPNGEGGTAVAEAFLKQKIEL